MSKLTLLFPQSMETQNGNKKKWVPKSFLTKSQLFFQHDNSKRQFHTFLIHSLMTKNKNLFQKMLATSSAGAVFVCKVL
jgi:hypothetical protein